jgi:hypothetical protein
MLHDGSGGGDRHFVFARSPAVNDAYADLFHGIDMVSLEADPTVAIGGVGLQLDLLI